MRMSKLEKAVLAESMTFEQAVGKLNVIRDLFNLVIDPGDLEGTLKRAGFTDETVNEAVAITTAMKRSDT